MTREELIRYGEDYLKDLVTACCSISDIHKEFVRKSIKALKQESCEDCVNRTAVLNKAIDYGSGTMLIPVNSVKALPSVTPTPKWIPVTENTPPKGTICLWCNKQGSVFISAITYRSEYSSFVGKHGCFTNGLENYGNIVAWMPLPDPYKAETEKEE